jgi:hypothetical protein
VIRSRRLSAQTTAVVLALAQAPSAWHYGYQLCQQLGLKAGSVYPILMPKAPQAAGPGAAGWARQRTPAVARSSQKPG